MELPADELVVVGVLVGRDHASSPVRVQAESLQVLLAQRWEKLEPVVGIGELGDHGVRDLILLQDFVLGEGRSLVVLALFFHELLGRLVAASGVVCDFTL